MKKQKCVISLMLIALGLLTGCANVDQIIGEHFLKKSGVKEDEKYVLYEEYASNNELDESGYHTEIVTDDRPAGSIHIAFAHNNNLEVTYYTDAELGNVISTPCYVFPGDTIYASVSVSRDVVSSMYRFSEFRVYEYNDQDKRYISETIIPEPETDGIYRISVPSDYQYKEVSIEPRGVMQSTKITLQETCIDDTSIHSAGTWSLNDDKYDSGVVSINAFSPYIVSYQYDSDLFFCYDTEPECYYQNSIDGIVIFKQREAEDEITDYKVVLHKYLSYFLVSDTDRIVSVNGGTERTVQTNDEIEITGLKYGDKVTIVTNKEWPGMVNCKELVWLRTESASGGKYKYTLIVPEENGGFLFNPSEYSYENGSIRFKCFGETVDSPISLATGRRIYYEQVSAAEGYWLAGSDDSHYITVGTEEETIRALRNIHFSKKVDVIVDLPQPKVGGTIEYFINGTKINTDSVATYSGTEIEVRCYHWPGWICDEKDSISYVVGDRNSIVTINGKNVDTIFVEADSHKPKLSVTLEKSIGKDMKIGLKASGYSMEDVQYSDSFNLFGNSQAFVRDQTIGTGEKIEISFSNEALETKKAVRVQAVFQDKNNKSNKRCEVLYLEDISKELPPIYIYSPGTNATDQTTYSSIDISIGVVDIENYIPAAIDSHAIILLKNEETSTYLSKGDLIEPSTNVKMSLLPKTGYYVDGKNVDGSGYVETMKYSEYLERASEIISSHPIKKYVTMTLDASDEFAVYEYRLDGELVSGTIQAKEGQELELHYKIIDENHKLVAKEGGFLGFGESDTEATKSFVITSNKDGKRIWRLSFGLAVK